MRIRLIYILFIFLALLNLNVNANTTFGNRQCTKWNEMRSMPLGDTKQLMEVTYQAWVYGFLSGIAVMGGGDYLGPVEPKQIDRWMDQYCKKYPNNRIGEGASEFYLNNSK